MKIIATNKSASFEYFIEEKYEAGALVVAITDENGERYEAPLPAVSFGIGERTIVNVEWVPESVTLPDGPTFNEIVGSFMDGNEISSIKFITGSTTKSENELVENSVFLLKNGDVLEIHTASEHYLANSNSSRMFCSYDGHTSFSLLKSIDFGNSFNTGYVTDMSAMFGSCSSFSTLDVSSFDTYNVTNMASMFSGCSSLTSLDLSNFDTRKVTDMEYMFAYCSRLNFLDISTFSFKAKPSIVNMFVNAGTPVIYIYISVGGKAYIESIDNDDNPDNNTGFYGSFILVDETGGIVVPDMGDHGDEEWL